MRRPARFLAACLVVTVASSLAGCAPSGVFADNVYSSRDGKNRFRVGPLPAEWRRVSVAGGEGQVGFHHQGGGSMLANGTCEKPDDAPLDVLVNHLLLGFEDRKELSRAPFSLDGRRALRARVDASLDGVPVLLDLVVVRKDGCVYDFQLVSGPGVHARRRADFDGFVAGFQKLP